MKRTRALLLPLIASLLALPLSNCGGEEPDPGSKESDSGDSKDSGDNKKDSSDSDASTGGETPKDSGDKPDPDSTGEDKGTQTGEVKPSEGPIDCSKLKTSTINPTGVEPDQVPPDVTLLDAKGNKVSLHNYCNDHVLLVFGTAY